MNDTTRREFTSRYAVALRSHLGRGAPETIGEACALGELAVSVGMETLEIARIHGEVLAELVEFRGPESFGGGMRKRVSEFLAAALEPVEGKPRPGADASDTLIQLNKMLAMRTLELADSRRRLELGIVERKEAEASLEASRKQSSLLLGEARDLESKLQNLARRIFTVYEGERKERSLVLDVEIAQTLLGIHVHLLALDREISVCGSAFKKEIARAQRMVDLSVGVIGRLVREFGINYNA